MIPDVLHGEDCYHREIMATYNYDFDDFQVRYYNRYYERLVLEFHQHVRHLEHCKYDQTYLAVS